MTPRQEAVRRVLARHSDAFDYGTSDCCQLALEVARSVRALRPGAPPLVAPEYACEGEAAAVIAHHGGMQALVTTVLGHGPTDKPPRDGDVALVHMVGVGEALAVWCSGKPLVKATTRFISLPPGAAKFTWSVD